MGEIAERVVTVDGLASSGKSSLSRSLAEKLGWAHFHSGGVYRAVAALCVEERVSPDDEEAIARLLDRHAISLGVEDRRVVVLVDGGPLRRDLSAPQVSDATSRSSRFAAVRQRLLSLQRDLPDRMPIVAEGRDMGTVVFPEARVKFFVTAPAEIRAARRLAQLVEQRPTEREQLLASLKIEIDERDQRDSERAIAPTKAADDAILIDNGVLPLTEVVESMYRLCLDRGLGSVR